MVFENLGPWAYLQEIWKTIDMVAMPVCQKGLVHCRFFLGEHGLKVVCPYWGTLAGVYEDSVISTANKVCVCAYFDLVFCMGLWMESSAYLEV